MTATDSLAAWLAGHDPDHSEAFHRRMAGRVVANWKLIAEWCREDAAADTTRNRDERPLNTDDATALDELAAWHKRNAEDFERMAASARRGYRDEYNPDERDADRQDQRDTQAAHDEHAAQNAPRVAS